MNILNRQSGYMMEVPLLLMVIGTMLAILLPLLPAIWGKALVICVGLLLIAGLYYMIVIPGWQPDNSGRVRKPYNFILFGFSTALVISAVIGFIIFA
jgi:hypothetical protein